MLDSIFHSTDRPPRTAVIAHPRQQPGQSPHRRLIWMQPPRVRPSVPPDWVWHLSDRCVPVGPWSRSGRRPQPLSSVLARVCPARREPSYGPSGRRPDSAHPESGQSTSFYKPRSRSCHNLPKKVPVPQPLSVSTRRATLPSVRRTRPSQRPPPPKPGESSADQRQVRPADLGVKPRSVQRAQQPEPQLLPRT